MALPSHSGCFSVSHHSQEYHYLVRYGMITGWKDMINKHKRVKIWLSRFFLIHSYKLTEYSGYFKEELLVWDIHNRVSCIVSKGICSLFS